MFPMDLKWKTIGTTSLPSIYPNITLHVICRTLSLYKLTPISFCALTPVLYRYAIWKTTSRLSVQSLQDVCSATRPISARSHCLFHQVEGLYIDKNVSFADLKQTLLYFTKEMFGKSRIRLRPSYFPFTEPSAEVDIYWGLNNEVDYRITKGTGWLEIMGCGMTDPNVLKNCGIDSEQYSGFAFGMGVERIAMLLYQIGDIRMFYENDARFLEQFKSAL